MIAQIQMRRGTSAEWAAAAPVILSAGEPGYDTTEKKMKVGDGSTEWANLDFLGASDCPFPINSLFFTDDANDNPATRWPGTTWTRKSKGRALFGVDENDTDFSTAGKTGGTKTKTLSVSNLPSHRHNSVDNSYFSMIGGTNYQVTQGANLGISDAGNMYTSYTGGGTDFTILNPYETTFIYKRTA